MAEKIAKWYRQGLWSAEMVRTAARKGAITQGECEEIISKEV